MRAHQAEYPVATMCRVLDVSTSGYYAWLKRPASARAGRDAELSERIVEIHEESRKTYGVPRVHAELKAGGERVARKRVARLMRTAGLQGVSRRSKIFHHPTGPGRATGAGPGRSRIRGDGPEPALGRGHHLRPDLAGFLYLAVVLDVWSRRMVGWAMANHLRTELVLDALNMAIRQRRPAWVIHHSDQGCQYTSLAFGLRCREAGVRPSMGSVGDCYDNAMCESFFATLECELLADRRYRAQAEAKMSVFEFIEGWYNPRRRHSALGYLSPIEFERAYQTAGA